MYKVIRDVIAMNLEDKLNDVDSSIWVVDQVIPTLAFENKSIAMITVPLPSEIKFNIILKKVGTTS